MALVSYGIANPDSSVTFMGIHPLPPPKKKIANELTHGNKSMRRGVEFCSKPVKEVRK